MVGGCGIQYMFLYVTHTYCTEYIYSIVFLGPMGGSPSVSTEGKPN